MENKHIGVNEIFNIYKKYIRNILRITFVAFFLSIIYSIFATPLYKSYISIYPQNNEKSLMPPSMLGIEVITFPDLIFTSLLKIGTKFRLIQT